MLTQALVEPPVNLLVLVLVGLLLRGDGRRLGTRRPGLLRRFGGWLAGLGFLGLVVLSLPASAQLLLRALEHGLPLAPAGTLFNGPR